MSYQDAIEAMRERSVQPAPIERLRVKQERADVLPKRVRSVARKATVVATLGFGVLFLRKAVSEAALFHEGSLTLHLAALLPMCILLWSLRRIDEPRLGPQLSCRAVWWSNLVVGVLISMNYGMVVDRIVGVVIAAACAVALRSAGERGLDVQEADHPFAPVRFRGHLLLALVMAAADALTLAFSALLQLRLETANWQLGSTIAYAGPTLAAALVMGVAVWGVYRLRTWALFLNLVANIAIAYLALEGTLNLSPSVSVALATTAAIQSFIPVPILAVALGDRRAGQPLIARVRETLMLVALYGLVTVSLVGSIVGGADGWVDGPGRSFVRGTGARSTGGRGPFHPDHRERLGAVGNDLRDWSFADQVLTRADFDGVDLRGVSFEAARLHGARFAEANLGGASFVRADVSGVSFESAKLAGADFTGAFTTDTVWPSTGGFTCPDGRPAYEVYGCYSKRGTVPRDDERDVVVVEPGTGTGCPDEGAVSVADVSQDGYLRVLGHETVMLYDGGVSMRWVDRVDVEGSRWTLEERGCRGVVIDVGPSPFDEMVVGGGGGTRDFSGRTIGRVDLRGHDLKAASFERSTLDETRLDEADLRDANFRRAVLDQSPPTFSGADLRGADFTGAGTVPVMWLGVEPSALAGATCPDGRLAHLETGCNERSGRLRLDPVPASTTVVEAEGLGESCSGVGEESDVYAFSDRIHVAGLSFVPLDDGRFMSSDGTLEVQADGTWVVDSEVCGRLRLRPRGAIPLDDALVDRE